MEGASERAERRLMTTGCSLGSHPSKFCRKWPDGSRDMTFQVRDTKQGVRTCEEQFAFPFLCHSPLFNGGSHFCFHFNSCNSFFWVFCFVFNFTCSGFHDGAGFPRAGLPIFSKERLPVKAKWVNCGSQCHIQRWRDWSQRLPTCLEQ